MCLFCTEQATKGEEKGKRKEKKQKVTCSVRVKWLKLKLDISKITIRLVHIRRSYRGHGLVYARSSRSKRGGGNKASTPFSKNTPKQDTSHMCSETMRAEKTVSD